VLAVVVAGGDAMRLGRLGEMLDELRV